MDLKSTARLNNGVGIPWIGFGTYKIPPGEETYRSVRLALEAGYRSVDTASFYQNEADVGAAVRDSGLPRDEIFVTTKLWNDEHGYEGALKACAASLRRMKLEQVDLYLIHWPVRDRYRDTWRAMEKLVREGQARSIGVSNFLIHHLEDLMKGAEVRPALNQVEFHPFLFASDLLEYCQRQDIQLEAWSPLTRARFLDNPVLVEAGRARGKTPAQVLLRWALQHRVVTLPKSTRETHIRENAAVFDFTLSTLEMARIDALDNGTRIGPHPDQFA